MSEAELTAESSGGDDGSQTHDLRNANAALYQLSYVPKNETNLRFFPSRRAKKCDFLLGLLFFLYHNTELN